MAKGEGKEKDQKARKPEQASQKRQEDIEFEEDALPPDEQEEAREAQADEQIARKQSQDKPEDQSQAA